MGLFTTQPESGIFSVINQVQDILVELDGSCNDISLPQMVVIGDQSAGKSSMIERIVGRDFLPRGTGVVTRMPLILHLVNRPLGDPERKKDKAPIDKEYAMFNDDNTVYMDFEKVRERIQVITDREAGTNMGIVDRPIRLRIVSDKVTNLSLVDLPGFVSVPVGDQPADIEEQVLNLINKYIQNENSLILAVTPANADLATSKALKVARSDRTIAVFTKLDLMDKGTCATEMLSGTKFPVKLGICGVVNRGEAIRSKPLDEVDADEKEFFKHNYPKIADKQGCSYLVKLLNKVFYKHIQAVIPSVIENLNKKIAEQQEIKTHMGKDYEDPKDAIVEIVLQFINSYINLTYSGEGVKIDPFELDISPSSKIATIFYREYMDELNNIQPLKDFTREQIKKILISKTGLKPHIFPPASAFSDFIATEVKKLLDPSINCAGRVHDKLMCAIEKSDVNNVFKRFPQIKNLINTVIKNLLDKQLELVESLIDNCIQSQGSHINTRSAEFQQKYDEVMKQLIDKPMMNGDDIEIDLLSESANSLNASSTSDDEDHGPLIKNLEQVEYNHATERIIRLVPFYFGQVRANVFDMVTKTIAHNLIIYLHENMSKVLITHLMDTSNYSHFFQENQTIVEERADCKQKLKRYYRVREALNRFSIRHDYLPEET